MAAFDHVSNMCDVTLRPRLLCSLIRDHVPDDKNPLGSPLQLSKVISIIKTHDLLSESSELQMDQRLFDNWKSALDSWLNRLLQLVSNDMPDKCWAGICLLGVTIQECSSDRFLASYSVWFQTLLSRIQLAEASHFVKVASCASISDLLTRLGGFPNVKKDGTALAGKLIQPLLKLLNDDPSEAIWDGALHLLCTIITSFPFSIGRHYESAEASIASKILSGNCSFNMLKKLAHCLALLPKSRGDKESWSLMIQKVLIWISIHLNNAFQGFEEDTKSHEAIRLLVPRGKDLPPPLGGLGLSGEPLSNSRKTSEHLLTSSVSSLMLCCCSMLTSSYPVQVTVPVRALLGLVERVLMMDASLPHSLRPFVTAMQQEYLSSELPVLHLNSLELLTAIIKGVRSQLLPHAASIVRLVSVYFKKCKLPELRMKAYSITKILLLSMGVGMASCLAPELVNNAFVDLNPICSGTGDTSSSENPKTSTEALSQPSRRKRKHSTPTGSLEAGDSSSSLEVGALKNHPSTLISLRVAALEALEALLTVGGALRSEGWRSNLDLLLINIVKNSLKGGLASEEINIFRHSEPTESWANLQLAAMRALLASFLSSHVRSPYLAEGLELFTRGKQESSTKLAGFCAHALLALEVLIHPRALPVEDFPIANCISDGVHKLPENVYSSNPKYITPFSTATRGMGHNVLYSVLDHDDLCDSWLENGKETEAAVSDPGETIKCVEIVTSETLAVHQNIKLSDDGFRKGILEESKQNPEAAANADTEIHGGGDEIMAESNQHLEGMPQNQDFVSERVSSVPTTNDVSTGAEMVVERITSDIGSSKQAGNDLATDEDALVAKTDGTSIGTTAASSQKREEFTCEMDHESEMEPFPDIVDADPDSDYE